jgi:hypothetical protein
MLHFHQLAVVILICFIVNGGNLSSDLQHNSFVKLGFGSVDTGANYSVNTMAYWRWNKLQQVLRKNTSDATSSVLVASTGCKPKHITTLFIVMNYSNTTTYKTVLLARGNAGSPCEYRCICWFMA